MIPNFSFAVRADLIDHLKNDQKFKPEDFLPSRAEPYATGYDLRCAKPGGVELKPLCYFKIPLGVRMLAPEGWWLELVPRSSTFIKRNIHPLYGVIDNHYSNELVFAGQFIPDAFTSASAPLFIEFGERIAQAIPVRLEPMNVSIISNADYDRAVAARGARDGFGSTGKI